MSVRVTFSRISEELEEINTLSSLERKLETIRKQAVERLSITTNSHEVADLNRVIAVVTSHAPMEGWPSNLGISDPPAQWHNLNRPSILELRAKITSLSEQVDMLKSNLPSDSEISNVKARVTSLAMDRRDAQLAQVELIESTAPVLMSLVDLLTTQFLPVYENELLPLERDYALAKERESQTQSAVAEIMQRYDLARSYNFTIPVKPVDMPEEVFKLLVLCRRLITELVSGNKASLPEYESLSVKELKESQVA